MPFTLAENSRGVINICHQRLIEEMNIAALDWMLGSARESYADNSRPPHRQNAITNT